MGGELLDRQGLLGCLRADLKEMVLKDPPSSESVLSPGYPGSLIGVYYPHPVLSTLVTLLEHKEVCFAPLIGGSGVQLSSTDKWLTQL